MKKLVLSLMAVLVVVFIVLSALGSGGGYAAEKLFFRAMKTNQKIVINPDVAPPALLASVEKDLQALLAKYPDTNIAKTANIALTEFYINNKKYDKALSLIESIFGKYSKDEMILSTVQFLKGVIYEKMNRWDDALAEFRRLRDKYPNTKLGIQIPIYIGQYYNTKGKEAEAKNAYREAAAFYEKMERDNSGKMIGYTASALLLQTYINLRSYDEAGKALEDTLNKYPGDLSFMQILPYVDLIFIEKLNQREKAISIYKGAKDKARDERLRKALEKKIAKLEAKK